MNGNKWTMNSILVLTLQNLAVAFTPCQDCRILIEGVATHPKTGRVLYQEERVRTIENGQRVRDTVSYRDSSGLLATKNISYGARPLLPSFHLQQLRPKFSIQMQVQGDSVVISKLSKGKQTQRKVKITPKTVGEAGIDLQTIAALPTLAKGNEVAFTLLVPEHARAYGMKLIPLQAPQESVSSQATQWAQLSPSNTLLSWLTDGILVGYDAQGVLLEYRGVSDIKDSKNKNHLVSITYKKSRILP